MFVAVHKPKGKAGQQEKSRLSQAVVIFWLVFIILVVGIFLANRSAIEKNFKLFTQRLSAPPGRDEKLPTEMPPFSSDDEKIDEPADRKPPVSVIHEPADQKPAEQKPAAEPPPSPKDNPRPPEPQAPAPKPTETRDRNLYFIQIDNDGQILRSRVIRKITVSDSPLQDALAALLAGPDTQERNRGIISLIPPNTRLLSAIVRGTTAYISFSEDFLFNTYGVEGYAAQLRQIAWTATEFSTVGDVQILIEGKRVDFLGEGIWIGSPINRQSY